MPAMNGLSRMRVRVHFWKSVQIESIGANLNIRGRPFNSPTFIAQDGSRKDLGIKQGLQLFIRLNISTQIECQRSTINKAECKPAIRERSNCRQAWSFHG
ncbi:hypothetical protein PS655_01356 [Pseudomonas fluorescens]|uniref:Uncharacterized protein n=1 Tax=Pseudomonas fluorescens TaxID=294 RepID=A0A5E6R0W7_PSEFL|nr:hypothetical protein PS655_01356 [Pseudomonas fluorescens]